MLNEFGVRLDSNGYAPSIMGEVKGCYLCGFRGDLARHEVFHGSNREKSKNLGCWVNLCPRCHERLHKKDPKLDWDLKRHGQVRTMAHYGWTVAEFIERFGMNYV